MKVVINRCFGGYSLSVEARRWLFAHGYRGHASPVAEYFGKTDVNGRFGLSQALATWRKYQRNPSETSTFMLIAFSDDESVVLTDRIERDNPLLVQCVEELGERAGGSHAQLAIVEVPDDAQWDIAEYDGMEHVAEVHRTWS